MRSRRAGFVLVAIVSAAWSCARGPRPLVAGEDGCDYCRMTITDTRFGGQIVTPRAMVRTFDAVECLASSVAEAGDTSALGVVYVSDYGSRTMVRAEDALFVRGGAVRSPMGREIAAFAGVSAARLRDEFGGEILRWHEVVAIARSTGPVAHDSPGAHANHVSPPRSVQRDTIHVSPASSTRPIADAIAKAAPGTVIVLAGGVYREPTVTIDRPLTIDGLGAATLDGERARGLVVVAADDVTVRGLVLRNTGHSSVEDRAALRVTNARRCTIERNRLDDTMFGIYLEKSTGCVVRDNDLTGLPSSQIGSGNGIHLWYADSNTIERNRIRGHRDGIYFEFVKGGVVTENESETNQRYGLHFMFSDDCRYERNRFVSNQSGVAVMYSKRVVMHENAFVRNWGSAAYGLLLKEISDSEIRGNEFTENSVGLHLEGSNRNRIEGNVLTRNGWALRMMANAQDNLLRRNRFSGNSFDVTTNSRQNFSTFSENSWDRYHGYDLDRDGYGDVPHRPVRLFALVVEQSPPLMILQHSVLVDLLDVAERLVPSLTPETLVDERPLMQGQAPRADARGGVR